MVEIARLATEVVELQHQRQASEEVHDRTACSVVVNQSLRYELAVVAKFSPVKPGVVELLLTQKQVQIVIAEDALRQPGIDKALDQIHDGRTVPVLGR